MKKSLKEWTEKPFPRKWIIYIFAFGVLVGAAFLCKKVVVDPLTNDNSKEIAQASPTAGSPTKYPGDEYIKQLIASQGYVKPDVNRNIITGQNVTVTNSVNNLITADNAQVNNSHNNILNAKNVVIVNASGCRADGADHTIKSTDGKTANYSCVDGDANWVEGYGSKTSGFGNDNCIYAGQVHGQNCKLGVRGQGNKFMNSSARGYNIIIQGSNSHGIGGNFTIVGDNITVIGIGTGQTFTVPGTYILNPK